MITNVREIRSALLAATANMPVDSKSGTPTPATTFAPISHIKALHPQVTLVVGKRGMGKTFWTQALQDEYIRSMLARYIPEFARTQVAVGYGNTDAPERYPSTKTFSNLLQEYAPEDIWRAIIVHAIASHPCLNLLARPFVHGEWADDIKAVQSSPDKIEEYLHEANATLAEKDIFLLILFDALDHTAYLWKNTDTISIALLKTVLKFSRYSSIKTKIFIREDHFKRISFPDEVTSILVFREYLAWNDYDLYSLLWQILCNAPDKYGKIFRSIFIDEMQKALEEKNGIWQIDSYAQLNDKTLTPLVHKLTGPFMGDNAQCGFSYVWFVGHLADTHLQTTPGVFLFAIRRACEDTAQNHMDAQYPIHFESLCEAALSASEIRILEMKEDNPWAVTLLSLLKEMSVPCSFREVEAVWKKAYPRGPGMLVEEDPQLAPPEFADGNWNDVRKALEDLGFCFRLLDGGFHIPDIYRIGFCLGRKGGVKPLPN